MPNYYAVCQDGNLEYSDEVYTNKKEALAALRDLKECSVSDCESCNSWGLYQIKVVKKVA